MPLRKFKRGDTWYIRGSVNGERIYRSAHTADEAQAEEARARLEARLWDRAESVQRISIRSREKIPGQPTF